MKRTRVIVLAAMGLLILGVYALLAGLLMGWQPDISAGAPPVAATPVPLEERARTAQAAYAQAEVVALDWQEDARLVRASASWSEPTAERLLTEDVAWVFYFFSQKVGRLQRVVVDEQGVSGEAAQAMDRVPVSIDPDEWQVDSPDALVHFLAHGGREFLTEHHVTTMRVQLSAELLPGRLVWMVVALASTDRTAKGVWVDAVSGEVEPMEAAP